MRTKILAVNLAKSEIEGTSHDGRRPYMVDPLHCAITLNGAAAGADGKPFKLADLRAGDECVLDGQTAVSIAATRS